MRRWCVPGFGLVLVAWGTCCGCVVRRFVGSGSGVAVSALSAGTPILQEAWALRRTTLSPSAWTPSTDGAPGRPVDIFTPHSTFRPLSRPHTRYAIPAEPLPKGEAKLVHLLILFFLLPQCRTMVSLSWHTIDSLFSF